VESKEHLVIPTPPIASLVFMVRATDVSQYKVQYTQLSVHETDELNSFLES
jgi:hypothetical protein